jgi:putative ABC transport system permease protein
LWDCSRILIRPTQKTAQRTLRRFLSATPHRLTREFGIRLALGASSGDVAWSVVRRGATLAIVGVALGAAGAVALTRSLQALLFDTQAIDPFAFVVATLVLISAALLAAWLPARRAARVDPVLAMRAE